MRATRWFDPGRCPLCAALLQPPAGRCPGCGVDLASPRVAELGRTLQRADQLTATIVAERFAEMRPAPEPPEQQRWPLAVGAPMPAAPAANPVRRRDGRSIGWLLLAIGALCLAIAAAVFVAVSWDRLGLLTRGAVLLTTAALFAAGSEVSRRRGLRASAEALAAVSVAVTAATGFALGTLLGLSASQAHLLGGAAVFTVSLAWCLFTRRSPLLAPQLTALVGWLWGIGAAVATSETPLPGHGGQLVLVLPALVGAGVHLRSRTQSFPVLRHGLAAAGALCSGVAALRGLTMLAWGGSNPLPGLERWASAWPILAVAAIWLVTARLTHLSRVARALGVATGVLLSTTVIAALHGALRDPVALDLAWYAVTLVALLVLHRRPGIGRRLAIGAVLPGALVGVSAWAALLSTILYGWVSSGNQPFKPWQLAAPGFVLASLLTIGLLRPARIQARGHRLNRRLRFWPAGDPQTGTGRLGPWLTGARHSEFGWRDLAPFGVLAVAITLVAGDRPWLSISILCLAGAILLGLAAYARSRTALWCAAPALVVLAGHGYVVASRAPATVAAVMAVLLSAAWGLTQHRWRHVGLGFAALVLPWALWLVVDLARLDWTSPGHDLVAHLLTGLAALAWCASARLGPGADRVLAVGAGCYWGLVAVILVRAEAPQLWLIALGLGIGLLTAGFLSRSAAWYFWPAGVLLTGALWLRLSLSGLSTLEVYTVPPAVALLAWGLLRLRAGRGNSWTNLLPGLLLGLAGSWALALSEPVSPRALLVGLALLACLVSGALTRRGTLLLVGAVGLTLLALTELWPLAAYLPRWVLLAAAGILLVGMGVTWEARLRQLRRLGGFVGTLR
ncbi:hypothetical protein CGZ93_09405 [Enemella dayhoffiae]|uniref:DUF2157 domain-containing protein n=1 Tax=Enemella dayhoffiae TaxID=2016507 RepID=A0A255H476_9ACTN|nr:DUF2157 domain-containing protein [Enemella dayhoffiae]OYO22106.1 hypothetical protein CGZ93_09405 [Enemella dayhoffiae]